MWGALIAAAISLVAGAIGTSVANKKKAAAEKEYQNAMNKEMSDIDKQINSNFLGRADAQNAIRKMTDSNTESLRQLNTDAIRGGATDEAKVAMASKLTKNTASLVGDLAAVGEQHKDSLRNQKRNLRLGLINHEYGVNSDTSGIERIVASVGSAANSLGSAIGSGSGASKAGAGGAASTSGASTASAGAASTPMASASEISPDILAIKDYMDNANTQVYNGPTTSGAAVPVSGYATNTGTLVAPMTTYLPNGTEIKNDEQFRAGK